MLKSCPECGKKYLIEFDRCPHCQAENATAGKSAEIKEAEVIMQESRSQDLHAYARLGELESILRGATESGLELVIFGLVLVLFVKLAPYLMHLDIGALQALVIIEFMGLLSILGGAVLIYLRLRD